VNNKASLSERTEKSPGRDNRENWPDHKKVNPNIQLRGSNRYHPLQDRVERSATGCNKEHARMAACAEGGGPEYQVPPQEEGRHRQYVWRLPDEQRGKELHSLSPEYG